MADRRPLVSVDGTAHELPLGDAALLDAVQLRTGAGYVVGPGELAWNAGEGTVNLGLDAGVVLQVGQETHYHVTNATGALIPNGTLVMAVGAADGSGKIKIAPWDGTQHSKTIMGLATNDIADQADGYVTAFGAVRSIQTDGANYSETWAVGDILYAGTTGGLTKTLPAAPNSKTTVALVINAHSSSGILFVRPTYGSQLGEDELVELFSLAAGDLIQYTSNNRFENKAVSQIGAQIYHGFVGFANSQILFDSATKILTLRSTNQDLYLNGVKYTLNGDLTVSLGATPALGTHYIVTTLVDGQPALTVSQNDWSIVNVTYTPTATVYWNGTAGALGNERHGHSRDLQFHRYLHLTVGARIPNDGGFAQTRPNTTNDAQLELSSGTLWDEDINNVISTAQGKLCRLWYETAPNAWTFVDGTDNGGFDRPFLWNAVASRVQFPESDNNYVLANSAANNYVPVWVYASNDTERPIYVVTPSLTTTYNTVADARNSLPPIIPFAAELKLLYRWIYRGDGQYQESADYRNASSLPAGGVSSIVAAAVSYTPTGTISATNVQAAIEEVNAEFIAHNHDDAFQLHRTFMFMGA